jgi:hypothetical protein
MVVVAALIGWRGHAERWPKLAGAVGFVRMIPARSLAFLFESLWRGERRGKYL